MASGDGRTHGLGLKAAVTRRVARCAELARRADQATRDRPVQSKLGRPGAYGSRAKSGSVIARQAGAATRLGAAGPRAAAAKRQAMAARMKPGESWP